jgi:hypothetical protein
MSEKRKEHRLKANMPIQVSCGQGKALRGRTENISRLGTYVELPQEIAAGQTVDLVLELPAYTRDVSLTGEVRCEGTVFRSSPVRVIDGRQWYGLGIFFTDFASLRDKENISAYVDHLIGAEEQEIKEGLKRRKEKESAHAGAAGKKEAASRQDEFQKEALGLLQQISSRLEALARELRASKK